MTIPRHEIRRLGIMQFFKSIGFKDIGCKIEYYYYRSSGQWRIRTKYHSDRLFNLYFKYFLKNPMHKAMGIDDLEDEESYTNADKLSRSLAYIYYCASGEDTFKTRDVGGDLDDWVIGENGFFYTEELRKLYELIWAMPCKVTMKLDGKEYEGTSIVHALSERNKEKRLERDKECIEEGYSYMLDKIEEINSNILNIRDCIKYMFKFFDSRINKKIASAISGTRSASKYDDECIDAIKTILKIKKYDANIDSYIKEIDELKNKVGAFILVNEKLRVNDLYRRINFNI